MNATSRLTDKDQGKVLLAGIVLLMACKDKWKTQSTLVNHIVAKTGCSEDVAEEAFTDAVRDKYIRPHRRNNEIYWEAI
jgi:hypothetical protein